MSKHETKKCILLNNLESKHSLVMKVNQFMSYYKRRIFMKKSCKKCGLETGLTPYFIFKQFSVKRNLRESAF